MATESEMYQSFINFATQYLNSVPAEEVNDKLVGEVVKVILKLDLQSALVPTSGSFEEDKLDKLKKEHGVE